MSLASTAKMENIEREPTQGKSSMTDAQRIEGLQNALTATIAAANDTKTTALQVDKILDGSPTEAATRVDAITNKLGQMATDCAAAIETYGAS